MKIAVLGSTRGTDLQAIIDANLPGIEIAFVLSNKAKAEILDRAHKHGLRSIFLDPKGKSRGEYDAEISKLLEEHDVELILLIGYMKLLSPAFVERWKNKVMNIHPSLLPAFAGGMDRNVHQEVLARGCKISGATLIFIDSGADTGSIIAQRTVVVNDYETVDSLKEKVQKVEGEMLVDALEWYRDGKIRVEENKIYVDK